MKLSWPTSAAPQHGLRRTKLPSGIVAPLLFLNLLGNWLDPADGAANISWIRNLFARLRPAMIPGVYVNFMSGDEGHRVPEAYRKRWERLRAIKTIYDPSNFFRLNQNIPPLTAAASGILE